MPEVFGVGQSIPRIEGKRIALDAPVSQHLKFGRAWRCFHARFSGGLTADQVRVLVGVDAPERTKAGVVVGDFRLSWDPLTFPVLRLDEPVDELWLVTMAAAAGQTADFYGVAGDVDRGGGAVDATIVAPLSGGVVHVGMPGQTAGNSVLGQHLKVNTYPRRGTGVAGAGWNLPPVNIGAGASATVASDGDCQGFFVAVVTAGSVVYIRRTNVAAAAGPQLKTADGPVFFPGTTDLCAFNPGGAAVDVSVAAVRTGVAGDSL